MEDFQAQATHLRELIESGAPTETLQAELAKLRALHRTLDPQQRKEYKAAGQRLAEAVDDAAKRSGTDWSEPMQAALDALGLDSFRGGQQEVIEHVLSGRDALMVIPTGGGKSLTYQVPSQILSGLTVVVSPLIALMHDQYEKMAELGAVMITSAQTTDEREMALYRLQTGKAKLLFVAPERFQTPGFLEALKRQRISLFVVDEAHCLSEMGHDFRPDYLRLTRILKELGRPTVLALTATATPEIAREIASRLSMRDPLVWQGGFDRPNLTFDVVHLEGKGAVARKDQILLHGLKRDEMRPAIVYCGTRNDTNAVAAMLTAAGIAAGAYHAGLDSDVRSSVQKQFMAGDLEVVAATNAFGMGVDKADVRSVWHYALPTSIEGYYQEAGRAGRDGQHAHAVLLALRSDLGRLIRFNKQREIDISAVDKMLNRLARLAPTTGSFMTEVRSDEDRIVFGVLERIGALEVRGASMSGLEGQLKTSELTAGQYSQAKSALRRGVDMGWKAYRAIERFSAKRDKCRRVQILEHFGDHQKQPSLYRCCDVCEAPEWLAEIADTVQAAAAVKRTSTKPSVSADYEAVAAGEGAELLDVLRAWRQSRASGKPAYTVCNNDALAAIAATRPMTDDDLLAIKGIGATFVDKHAAALFELLGEQ